jgi:glycosyltransferase involved in cell wall biosynthesis
MNVLLVLAYNEELNIEKTLQSNIGLFDKIIVVNDKSKDSTQIILENFIKNTSKIEIILNRKNYGPGKSMNVGLKESKKYNPNFIVKIDGDNQFKHEDIKSLLEMGIINNSDFIKCDRFWDKGIEGKIPKIRYFGNAFATLLIRAVTGNWKITDPLNGLFLFSGKMASSIEIPRFFNRYGYPFYINLSISKLSIKTSVKIHQFRNTIVYANETSRLSPLGVFFKLIIYSFYYFSKTIKTKLRYSNYQISGLIDVSALIAFLTSIMSLYMFIVSRFFSYQGNQNTWFLLMILFFITFVVLMMQSPKAMGDRNEDNFKYLN